MPSLTLGDFELTIFSDGTYPLDGGAFFGVVPKVMWSRKVEADERNYVTAGLNSLLIRTGKQTILVETGMGNKLSDRMAKIYGQPAQLLTNLAAGGISPEDIDIVINTHLHFDHCGWNTVRDTTGKIVPTFARARYYAPEGEWQYARKPSERDAISYIPDNYDPLVKSGQMTLLKGGEEIIPGISVQTFPGHTASMQAVIIRGGSSAAERRKNAAHGASRGSEEKGAEAPEGRKTEYDPASMVEETRNELETKGSFERARLQGAPSDATKEGGASAPKAHTACYISDLIPTTAHIDLTWGMSFDLYPLQTIESKKHYYAQSIAEKWLTVFTHDPKTPWAYVEKDDLGKMVAKPA
jgi:glyoxylase-like metal-dependent hydrolase (beta-lactamase superfamily II)